jgi:hypothetical protein
LYSERLEKKIRVIFLNKSQKRNSEIQVLDQKLNSLNVKEDDLCGDPESNVLSPKHNEIEKKLRKFIFCKGISLY